MDELSLLEADSIEAVPESASNTLPAPDFTGSLDYIDALARRSSITLSRRDISNIATAVNGYDYLSPLLSKKAVPVAADAALNFTTDFRPLGDARRFDPEFALRPPRALVRSASQVVASRVSPRADFPPGWRNPLDPTRDPDELNRVMRDIERRVLRKPWVRSFNRPNQVVICLKRKIRRHVLGAMGFPATTPFKVPRRTYWSRVVC